MASIAMMFGGAIINAALSLAATILRNICLATAARWQRKRGMKKRSRLMRPLKLATRMNAQNFLTGLKPTGKAKSWRNRTSPTPITPSTSTTRRTLTGRWSCPRSQNSLISINLARLRSRASLFLSVAARSHSATRLFVFFFCHI